MLFQYLLISLNGKLYYCLFGFNVAKPLLIRCFNDSLTYYFLKGVNIAKFIIKNWEKQILEEKFMLNAFSVISTSTHLDYLHLVHFLVQVVHQLHCSRRRFGQVQPLLDLSTIWLKEFCQLLVEERI